MRGKNLVQLIRTLGSKTYAGKEDIIRTLTGKPC